jgi:nucleotide-binding universal stress UspA family protein
LNTVVAAAGLDASSRAALRSASQLAAGTGATLHVVHALGPSEGGGPGGGTEGAEAAIRATLRSLHVADAEVAVHVIPGDPPATIQSFAARMHADVFVLGPHRGIDGGGQGNRLGGTARAVAGGSDAPCLILASPLRLPLDRVLVPIDRSDTARGALLVGLSWASGMRAAGVDGADTTLTVLHVDPEGEEPGSQDIPASIAQELARLRADGGSWSGVAVRGRVERGTDPAAVIAGYAEAHDADLVVLGTRGIRGDGSLELGSVSTAVAQRVTVPILLVPPAVWRAHAADG